MSITAHEQPRSKKPLIIIGAVAAALLLLLVGGAYALTSHYSQRALPGTSIAGQDVSGMTAAEISQALTKREGATTVTLDVDGHTTTSPLRETGVRLDANSTADKAVNHNAGIIATLHSFISGDRSIQPVITVNRGALEDYAHRVASDSASDPASNARVVFDADSAKWQAVPGHSGQALDVKALRVALEQKAAALSPITISAPIQQTNPALGDEDAQKVAQELNASLDKELVIVNPDYRVHEISRSKRASWIKVEPNEDGTAFATTVDRDKVASWVRDIAAGDVRHMESTSMGAPDDPEATVDYRITNTKDVTDSLVSALEKGDTLRMDFTVKQTVKPSKKAASPSASATASASASPSAPAQDAKKDDSAGADALPPHAPEGLGAHEKWIDVNLSKKTVTAYEGAKKVWGPVIIVDGKRDHETVTGTYRIYLRHEKQDMTNEQYHPKGDPEYYYTKDVPWVQYFYRGTAFHGAPWRSSFGYSGSHGCINMRVSDAKWLYGWARVGTLVVTHH